MSTRNVVSIYCTYVDKDGEPRIIEIPEDLKKHFEENKEAMKDICFIVYYNF